MATKTSVRIILDKRAINRLTAGTTDVTARRAAGRVRDRAKANLTASGRVNTGRLRDSITARNAGSSDPQRTVYEVGTNMPYAGYQEHGIGPVYPKRAKVLRFRPKGSSTFIFRPRTRGFPGAHYLERAYKSLTMRDYLP